MITSDEDIKIAMEWGLKSDKKIVGQAVYELYTTDLRENLKSINTEKFMVGFPFGIYYYRLWGER